MHRVLGLTFKRFRGYAAAQLSLDEGVQVISQTTAHKPTSSRGWDDFKSYLSLYPEFETPMTLVYNLTEQACAIYMARVAAGPDGPPLVDHVDRLKITMDEFPQGTPLEHILVWTVFIGAVESSTAEQRQYFSNLLWKHHKRNGFSNILRAIEFLPEQWARGRQDWMERLLELPFFVV